MTQLQPVEALLSADGQKTENPFTLNQERKV